jgi:hypothetical protein
MGGNTVFYLMKMLWAYEEVEWIDLAQEQAQ